MIFEVLSWIGVAFLMLSFILVAVGFDKKTASILSAIGSLTGMVAAWGMGIWSIAALNAAWLIISVLGSRIGERSAKDHGDMLPVAMALCVALLWFFGSQEVTWGGSLAYVAGWLMFSAGFMTRRGYLLVCALVGASMVPALILLGAHAFAFNEAFGAVVALGGLWRARGMRAATT